MRRNKTQKRGRVLQIWIAQILLAGGIGYVIGGWQTTTLRTDLSAAEAIARRFPESWNNDSAAPRALARVAATATPVSMADDGQLALLSPQPMVPQSMVLQSTVSQSMAPQPTVSQLDLQTPLSTPLQTASLETPDPQPLSESSAPAQTALASTAPPIVDARPPNEARALTPAVHHHIVNRPGYLLNDAQIASIKERLHLTPDQERMWPAVEGALRNMAYARAQEARGRAAPAAGAQVAAVDPNAVQGLKSAAVPLIMSFNEEQKEQVRDLAHVMGLDQLASEF